MTGERVCVRTHEVGSTPTKFKSSYTLDVVARWFHHDRSSGFIGVKTTGEGGLFTALPLDTALARLRDEGDLEGDGSWDNSFIVRVEGESAHEAPPGVGIGEVLEAVKALPGINEGMLGAINELRADFRRHFGGTVVASEVKEEELLQLRQALNVKLYLFVPAGEDVITLEEVAALPEEPDGFRWDPKVAEPLQAERYQPHLRQRVSQAIEHELKGKQSRMLAWKDAKGKYLTCLFAGAPFPLRAKNDEVLGTRGMDMGVGALLGVEMKKKVSPQLLWQMEVEFYTWDMNSLYPFCQLGMDGCRGGAAMWYDGYDGTSHIMRYQVFKGSAAVYTFAAKLIMGLPNTVFDLHRTVDDCQKEDEFMLPESLTSPKRRKLMGNGGVYPLAVGGLEYNTSSRGGGQGQGGASQDHGGGGQGQGGASAAPPQGGGAGSSQAAGGLGRGATQPDTSQPGTSGVAGSSNAAELPQPHPPTADINTQLAIQAANDNCRQDQYHRCRPIPWANVNPVIRKVVQLLHDCQAEDDLAVLEDVGDPAPYLAGADFLGGEEAIPEAP